MNQQHVIKVKITKSNTPSINSITGEKDLKMLSKQ